MKKHGMFISLFLALALFAAEANAASARGGFGGGRSGGFRGGGGSRSSSWGSKSSSSSRSSWGSSPKSSGSSWGSSSKSKPASSSWGSSSSKPKSSGWGSSWGSGSKSSSPSSSSSWGSGSSRSSSWTAKPKQELSSADLALAAKAKSSGTAYQSRSEATDAFKTKHASSYNSKYSAEPTARPDHIPAATVVDNRSYNVVYDRGHGGYGYYVGSRWIYYDALTDAVMLSALMNRHTYYYPGVGGYTYVSDGGSAGIVLIWVFGSLLAIIIIGAVVVKLSD